MLNEKEIIATGKDIIEALENGKKALGLSPTDEYEHEILHAGSRGILGIIGVKPAKVRIWVKAAEIKEKTRPERRQGDGKKKNNNKKNSDRKNENKKRNHPLHHQRGTNCRTVCGNDYGGNCAWFVKWRNSIPFFGSVVYFTLILPGGSTRIIPWMPHFKSTVRLSILGYNIRQFSYTYRCFRSKIALQAP